MKANQSKKILPVFLLVCSSLYSAEERIHTQERYRRRMRGSPPVHGPITQRTDVLPFAGKLRNGQQQEAPTTVTSDDLREASGVNYVSFSLNEKIHSLHPDVAAHIEALERERQIADDERTAERDRLLKAEKELQEARAREEDLILEIIRLEEELWNRIHRLETNTILLKADLEKARQKIKQLESENARFVSEINLLLKHLGWRK